MVYHVQSHISRIHSVHWQCYVTLDPLYNMISIENSLPLVCDASLCMICCITHHVPDCGSSSKLYCQRCNSEQVEIEVQSVVDISHVCDIGLPNDSV